MSDVLYVSKVRIERKAGPLRIANLPGEALPVKFSVHGAIAEHYKVDPAKITESHASTLDYVIAATAGWMMGTFGGALEARHIDASNGKLVAEVTGEVEAEEGVLLIRRIHVAMALVAPEHAREIVERVHGVYAMRCPLYRTLHNAIQLTSSYTLVAPAAVWQHRPVGMSSKLNSGETFPSVTINLVTGRIHHLPESSGARCRIILFYRAIGDRAVADRCFPFGNQKQALDTVGAKVVAAGVDALDKAEEVSAEYLFWSDVASRVTSPTNVDRGAKGRRGIMQPSEFIVGADGKKCHDAGSFDRLLGVSRLQSHIGVVAALKDSSGLVRAQHPTGLTMSKQNADREERTGE